MDNMVPPMGENAMVSGEWMNKFTGEVVTVRDSIIDGDNMLIITNKGHIDMRDFSDNYIQASDTLYDEKGNIIGHEDINIKDFQVVTPKMIQDAEKAKKDFNNEFMNIDEFITEEPDESDTITNIVIEKPNQLKEYDVDIIEKPAGNPVSVNYDIIDKVFKKISTAPQIKIDLEWEDFPKEQINTLINYLDIDINEIASYILHKYINNDINDIIITCINRKITI